LIGRIPGNEEIDILRCPDQSEPVDCEPADYNVGNTEPVQLARQRHKVVLILAPICRCPCRTFLVAFEAEDALGLARSFG
jgi:hypothetical protein